MINTAIIAFFIFIVSTFLFKKAAGTLNIGKINIVSSVYYIFILQSFIGTTLIILGYDEHYTLNYLLNKEKSCIIVAITIGIVAICLPLAMSFFQRIFRINMKKDYINYLNADVELGRGAFFGEWFTILSVFCLVLLIGFLIQVGYIPILKVLFPSSNFDFALERARIGKLFFIHPYVTNVLVLMLVPLLSYVSFAYFMKIKSRKWFILTGVLFIASIIVKTYKFEKSPLIFYFAVFILIYIYYKGGIKPIYMAIMAIAMSVIIIGFYFRQGFTGTILDIYNGPLGRTLFTEVGTLAYCFDMFPGVFDFLGGRSFSPTILKLLGMGSDEYLRSSKLTMAFYGSEKVYDGSAGVMNTLFVGEAYANWGYAGVVFSIIWIAFVLTFFIWLILHLKKTPSTVALLAFLTIKFGLLLEGGFCDFVYNFDILFTVLFILAIYVCFEKNGKLSNIVAQYFEKLRGKIYKNDSNN